MVFVKAMFFVDSPRPDNLLFSAGFVFYEAEELFP